MLNDSNFGFGEWSFGSIPTQLSSSVRKSDNTNNTLTVTLVMGLVEETHQKVDIDIFKMANQDWLFHAQIINIKVGILAFIWIKGGKHKVATF